MSKLIRRFHRDRRAATALLMTIMMVPTLICASAAVDFARIASARTLLQASIDSAVVAGVGTYQTSSTQADAISVATGAWRGTSAQLPNFVTVNSNTINAYCSVAASAAGACGGGSVAPATAPCAGAYYYCVTDSATVTLKNSLFAWIIPTDLLSANGSASIGVSTTSYTTPKTSATGNAYDLSGVYAYAVPEDNSSANNPKYDTMPTPNSACANVYGSLQYVPESGGAASSCNYLFVSDSTGDSGTGTISAAATDPIAFAFINDTGKTTSYGLDGTYRYPDNIVVNGSFYPNGAVVTCAGHGCSSSSTSLVGVCPQHNLFGALSQEGSYSNGSGGTTSVPSADSINVYSSAYEVEGYPPTHDANHALVSFIGPSVPETVYGTTYNVAAMCPQWPITNAQEVTDTSNQGIYDPNYVPADTNITAGTSSAIGSGTQAPVTNAYATYYPDVTESDAYGDIYPPQFSSCAPAAYPGGGSSRSWWGWSGSNSGNCGQEPASSSGTGYNNCALLIEPLGTNVPVNSNGNPLLPSYYLQVQNAAGTVLYLDPVWNNTTFIDEYPGTIVSGGNITVTTTTSTSGGVTTTTYTVTDRNASSYTPASTSSPVYNSTIGAYVVTPLPAASGNGRLYNPPASTSSRCYNPQANGIAAASGAEATNNTGMPIDPIENPQDGAIICNSNPPQSYGLYWNDMGGIAADDLGYWNSETVFTCSIPSGTSSGAATLLE